MKNFPSLHTGEKSQRFPDYRHSPLGDQQVGVDPLLGLFGLAAVEVPNGGGGKRLAERRHAMLPRLFANESEAFNLTEVLEIELDVLREGSYRPAVEIVHLNEHAKLAVLLDKAIDFWSELFVVLLRELARQLDYQNFPILVQFD
jgi:hypothetical protein